MLLINTIIRHDRHEKTEKLLYRLVFEIILCKYNE